MRNPVIFALCKSLAQLPYMWSFAFISDLFSLGDDFVSCLAGCPQDLPWLLLSFPLLSCKSRGPSYFSQMSLLCLFTGTKETWHFPAGGQWQQSYHRFNRAKNHQEQVGFLHPLVLLHAVQSSLSEAWLMGSNRKGRAIWGHRGGKQWTGPSSSKALLWNFGQAA